MATSPAQRISTTIVDATGLDVLPAGEGVGSSATGGGDGPWRGLRAGHPSIAALEERYRACADVTEARHVQAIWLLAKGHEIADVSATTAFGERWVERLGSWRATTRAALRHWATCGEGTEAARACSCRSFCSGGANAWPIRRPMAACGRASGKAAAWMAGELGLKTLAPQRGWEALETIGWSIQVPRPRHPASAMPEEREAFKKSSKRPSPRGLPCSPTCRSGSSPPTSTASA